MAIPHNLGPSTRSGRPANSVRVTTGAVYRLPDGGGWMESLSVGHMWPQYAAAGPEGAGRGGEAGPETWGDWGGGFGPFRGPSPALFFLTRRAETSMPRTRSCNSSRPRNRPIRMVGRVW